MPKPLPFLFLTILVYLAFRTLSLPHSTLAESLSVSLQVGSTKLTFSGTTNPNTLVTLKEENSTLASVASDATGSFTLTTNVSIPDSIHNYVLSTSYRSLNYSLNVPSNTETVIDLVDLIYIFPSPSATATTISSASPSTTPISSPTPLESPLPPSSLNPLLLYSGTPESPAPRFLYNLDPNRDGKISINELVTVVTSWFTNPSYCDLNTDKSCNLSDLSILLYYIDR